MHKFRLSDQSIAFFSSAQLFFSLSIVFGTWVIYIPQITEKLNMSEGQLGIVLFFGAIGSLIATPLGKIVVNKYGEGPLSFYSVLGLSVFIVAIFIAPDYYYLCAAFLMFGFNGGIYQIAVNSMVTSIENTYKISIMSRCHGFFSMGALISSGLGTVLLIALGNALTHVLIASGFVLFLQVLFWNNYYNIKNQVPDNLPSGKDKVKNYGVLIWLAFIAISAMVTEGAIADWSGLYLKDIAMVKMEYVGLGYAGFSLSMTIGRFAGDYFGKKFGALNIILGGFLVSILGFILILSAQVFLTIVGFIVVGSGFSIIVPEIYRLSANLNGINAATGIAFMSGAGYIGFLVGPPILGLIAESYGLLLSFMSIAGLVIIGTLLVIPLRFSSRLKLRSKKIALK